MILEYSLRIAQANNCTRRVQFERILNYHKLSGKILNNCMSFYYDYSFIIVVGLLQSKLTMETVPYYCQFIVLCSKQCRLWLMRPMQECQFLPHDGQTRIDAAESIMTGKITNACSSICAAVSAYIVKISDKLTCSQPSQ